MLCFNFHSIHFIFISLFFFLLVHYLEIFYLASKYLGDFVEIFLLLIFNLSSFGLDKTVCVLNFKFIKTYFITQNMNCLDKWSLCTCKECVFFSFWVGVFFFLMSTRSSWLTMFKSSVFLLVFCLVLSIIKKGVLKSLTVIM